MSTYKPSLHAALLLVLTGASAVTAAAASGDPNHRPPPPPPPPTSTNAGIKRVAPSDKKSLSVTGAVGATAAGRSAAVRMPPPPPPPPLLHQNSRSSDTAATTTSSISSARMQQLQQRQRLSQQQGQRQHFQQQQPQRRASLPSAPPPSSSHNQLGESAASAAARAAKLSTEEGDFEDRLASVASVVLGRQSSEESIRRQITGDSTGAHGAGGRGTDSSSGEVDDDTDAVDDHNNTSGGDRVEQKTSSIEQQRPQGRGNQQNSQQHMQQQTGGSYQGWGQRQPNPSQQPERVSWQAQQKQRQDQYPMQQQQKQQEEGGNVMGSGRPMPPQASHQSYQRQQQQQQVGGGAGRMPYQQQQQQQEEERPYRQGQPQQMVPYQHGGPPLQQQPRQMQQRPPPMQYRGQQQQQRRPPKIFNGILRRLERGLDAVASVEDAVDRRARMFGRTVKYATTGKMSVKEAAAASVAGSRQGLKEVRRAERVARQAPNMFDLFGDDIRAAEEQIEKAAEGDVDVGGGGGDIGGGIGGGLAAAGAAAASVGGAARAVIEGTNDGGGLDSLGMVAPWGESLLSNGGATLDGPTPSTEEQKLGGGAASPQQSKPQASPIEQLLGQQPTNDNGSGSSSALEQDSPSPSRKQPSRRSSLSYLDDDDDDDESTTVKGRLSKVFRSIPNPAALIPSWGRGSSLDLTGDWSDDDEEQSWGSSAQRAGGSSTPARSVIRLGGRSARNDPHGSDGIPSAVTHLLERGRSRTGESGFNLLTRQEGYRIHRLGRVRCLLDVAALLFVLIAISELTPYLAAAITEASTTRVTAREGTLPIVGKIQGRKLLVELSNAFSSAFDESWAPLAVASAFLSVWSNNVFLRPAVRRTASLVSSVVRDQVSYSQMFLCLVAALPPRKDVPEILAQASRHQVWSDVEASRLRSFVAVAVTALVALTISVAKPIIFAVFGTGMDIIALQGWKHWPLEWAALGQGMKAEFITLFHTLGSLLGKEWEKIVANPMGVVVQGSLFVALIAASILPTFVRHVEQKRSAETTVDASVEAISEEDEELDSERSTSAVLDIGVSSSTRLSLLSQAGGVEGTLERWSLMQPKSRTRRRGVMKRRKNGGGAALLRHVGYESFTAALLCLPIALYVFVVPSSSSVTESDRWSTGAYLVALLLFTYRLTHSVLSSISDEFDLSASVASFLGLLSGTADDITKSNQSPDADLQLTATTSGSKGISVTDFWAAHAARRAWACRGAQLSCQNGEVCLVLGDDGSGKSRLLTALAESILAPPSNSRSTVYVRGQVHIGGVDVTRWERRRLKRSLGLVLNDVRTLSDMSQLFSGCTLEEVLNPGNDGGGGPGSPSYNAMQIAMQVTGLSTGLLARFPSKLSTVVTANEDELRPSPIRPQAEILSPSEWSKVLLTRSIAQAVLSNENPMASPDAVQRSLIGSLLLLDDATSLINEVEEATLIKALRSTGAAVLLASNHWASGRFVDRIVVMKGGAVVESGTHAELLQRGHTNSLYALKWKLMASGSM